MSRYFFPGLPRPQPVQVQGPLLRRRPRQQQQGPLRHERGQGAAVGRHLVAQEAVLQAQAEAEAGADHHLR